MKVLVALLAALPAFAEVNRVVILKVDGLPEGLVEKYRDEKRLPWIDRVFAKNGVWMENFYVRGLSLSAPSWSLLDTGRHLEIRGNAEYDRYTLRVSDYLNFFPFYVGYAMQKLADMPGVELLDENHIPLLIDRFPAAERYQSFQLLQRGVRWQSLQSSMTGKFMGRPVHDIFDEWQTGFTMSSSVNEQTERELLAKLKDPNVHYLDYFTGDYDHTAHLTPDPNVQRHVIEQLDALVGRVWTAIQSSPLATTTMLVVVSDHGMNTQPDVYSQGYSLIDWFNSASGGGHHVLTNRHPMGEFKLKGLDPFVSEVISESKESSYLAGEASHYPTAVMDLDGNERASISLRNNSLNVIQILLDQLMHRKLDGRTRHAVLTALFETLDRVRPEWRANIDALSKEIEQSRSTSKPAPALQTKEEHQRQIDHLEIAKEEDRAYSSYIAVMRKLLSLDASDFDPGKFNTEDLIPRRSLSERNTLDDLRHYVVGLAPGGLAVAPDGTLDRERSFRTVDYFAALASLRVRNNVQPRVGPQPIDFIAVAQKDSVLLWRSPDRQVRIERRGHELRYHPVDGEWRAGLPLEIFEDPNFTESHEWLKEWHSERDWLRAVHRTKYSNGIVGIVEEMLSDPVTSPFEERKRQLRRADMIVFANDHWNFNVRGFNPGGNHGSFLRTSTHSVLLFAGGGIATGKRISTPYDSLSFMPTILSLMGRAEPNLPGPIIDEIR